MPGRLDQRRASGPLAAAPPPAASGNPLQRHRREEGRLSLKDESPAARIESAWLAEGAVISSTNLGEVLYIRLHSSIGDIPPVEFEQIYAERIAPEPPPGGASPEGECSRAAGEQPEPPTE